MEYSVWTAAYMAGALDAGRLIGVVEVFAARNGVIEAWRIDYNTRRPHHQGGLPAVRRLASEVGCSRASPAQRQPRSSTPSIKAG